MRILIAILFLIFSNFVYSQNFNYTINKNITFNNTKNVYFSNDGYTCYKNHINKIVEKSYYVGQYTPYYVFDVMVWYKIIKMKK